MPHVAVRPGHGGPQHERWLLVRISSSGLDPEYHSYGSVISFGTACMHVLLNFSTKCEVQQPCARPAANE